MHAGNIHYPTVMFPHQLFVAHQDIYLQEEVVSIWIQRKLCAFASTISACRALLYMRVCLSVCLLQVMKHVHYEDENTRYVDIGPVNKIINMLCCWFEDPNSTAFKK